jgi:hypothetical protein
MEQLQRRRAETDPSSGDGYHPETKQEIPSTKGGA